MRTGRFNTVQPEQLVRDERRRAQAESAAREAQRGATRRTRVSSDGRSTRAAGADGDTRDARDASARQRPSRNSTQTQRRRPSAFKILFVVAAIALVVALAQLCSTASPIQVVVNGTQYTLRGAKTLEVAIKESGLPLNPGDFISLGGNILKRHEGAPFDATVNGEETSDPTYQLHDGDQITLTDGKDIVEDYDAVEEEIPFDTSIVGTGSIHSFTPGVSGVKEIRTGRVSGEVVEKQTVDPQDLLETREDIGVGNNKVIALTFDDGPSPAFTEEILNVLAENDAKATFFCVGTAVESRGTELVRKAVEQGCQVCSHSYNNAYSAGGDFSLLAAEEQVEEVRHGLQVLADVLGYEPSHYVRVGDEDMALSVIPNVAPLIDAEIGWTLDTGDWVYMAEDQIYDVLMSAKAGDVVRMHDGGDHQDVTAAALKRALPKLKEQGFSFITIDELMALRAG